MGILQKLLDQLFPAKAYSDWIEQRQKENDALDKAWRKRKYEELKKEYDK